MPTPREALDEAELDGIIDNREPDPTRRHLGRDGRGESSGRGLIAGVGALVGHALLDNLVRSQKQ